MGSTTPALLLPYPVGTDRVMDGDDAIKALAERVEVTLAGAFVGKAARTTSAGPVLAGQSVPITGGPTYTFTLAAARTIRHAVCLNLSSSIANGVAVITLRRGGVTVDSQSAIIPLATYGQTLTFEIFESLPAGTYTMDLGCTATQGNITLNGSTTQPILLTSQDCGP